MKRLLLSALLATFALRACQAQTPQLGTHHTVSATFQIAGTAAWPAVACSTTTTTSCIVSITETIVPPTGASTIAPIVLPGLPTGHDYTPGGVLFCGTWLVSAVVNWKDDTGTAIDSAKSNVVTLNEKCSFTAGPASTAAILK